MRETQASIAAWSEQFGPASDLRIAIRAQEECVELMKALETGDTAAVEECADVVIVLCRLAQRLGVTLPVAQSSCVSSYTALVLAVCAHGCMSSILEDLASPSRTSASEVAADLIWTVDWLHACAVRLSRNLADEIDRKMAINRARKWQLDGNGCAYHVKDGEP